MRISLKLSFSVLIKLRISISFLLNKARNAMISLKASFLFGWHRSLWMYTFIVSTPYLFQAAYGHSLLFFIKSKTEKQRKVVFFYGSLCKAVV